jgi:hypothetical protein
MSDERTYGFSLDDAQSLIQGISHGEGIYPEIRPRGGGRADLTVVLDDGLASATNALTSPATATASVLRKNSSGNLEDTGDNITVVNRYEHIELEQYTIGMAKWIDAEWRMYSADCEALGSWP